MAVSENGNNMCLLGGGGGGMLSLSKLSTFLRVMDKLVVNEMGKVKTDRDTFEEKKEKGCSRSLRQLSPCVHAVVNLGVNEIDTVKTDTL